MTKTNKTSYDYKWYVIPGTASVSRRGCFGETAVTQ